MAENTPLIKLTSMDYGEVRDTPLGAKSAGKTPGNSGFEEMRSRIKNSLFNQKAQSLSIITSKNALEDVDEKSDKSGGSTTLIAPFAKKSLTPCNPRLERYRHMIKGSLSLGTHASFGVSEMNLSPFSRGEAMSDIGLSSVSRTSVVDDQSIKARELDDDINRSRSDKTLELEEVKEYSFTELEGQQEEKKEEKEVIVEISPKRQIFMNNLEQDIEELKKDLKVEEDPDIHFIKGNFKDFYTEGDVLGEGTTATVKKCLKIGTNEPFAVKIVHYRDDTEMLTLIVKEFKNYKQLEHKHVIRVYELYIDYWMKKIYTIMELAECREMFEVLQDLGHYSEAVASSIFKQILSGINYLHTNGVVHRDLKPNNLLVSDDGKIVKITDFNVSKFTENKSKKYSSLSSENTKMWTHTGTIAFTAPEVFTEAEYTESVDMWSAGVVLYTMLSGYQPFYAEYVNELIELITKAEIKFDDDPWKNISDQAKDLVLKCLDKNPKTRYLPSDALMHPWIRNHGKVSNKAIYQTVDNLRFLVNKRKERRRCNTKTDAKDFKLGTIRTRVKRSETTVSPLEIDMFNRDGLIQGDMGAKEHIDCTLQPLAKDPKINKLKTNGLGNLPRESIKAIIQAPCLQIPESYQEEKDGMSPDTKKFRHDLMKEGIDDIDEFDLGNISPFSLRRHQSMRVKISSKERLAMGLEGDSSEDSYLDSEEEEEDT